MENVDSSADHPTNNSKQERRKSDQNSQDQVKELAIVKNGSVHILKPPGVIPHIVGGMKFFGYLPDRCLFYLSAICIQYMIAPGEVAVFLLSTVQNISPHEFASAMLGRFVEIVATSFPSIR